MSDLISRKDAIELMKNDIENNGLPYDDEYNIGIDHAMCLLACVPTAEPKVGRWKPHPTEPEWDICTVCGLGTHRRQITIDFVEEENYQYCPHCGAKMERSE